LQVLPSEGRLADGQGDELRKTFASASQLLGDYERGISETTSLVLNQKAHNGSQSRTS
jgi:hypothetical protein